MYAREASEPILKPGEATEALLKAVTASVEAPEKVPTYEVRSPVGAVEIADYLWNEAYPKGATPAVALELFADDIRYEDFNYPKPFLGKAEAFRRAEMPRVERSFSSSIVSSTRVERDQIPQVKAFVEAFDIPGIEFVPTELSGGDDAVCFTWKVLGLCFDEVSSTRVEERAREFVSSKKLNHSRVLSQWLIFAQVVVNGNDGPKGVSFYGSNAEGKVDYIRDIPATAPAPLQTLAGLVNPALRKF